MLTQMAGFPSFSWLNNIPSHIYNNLHHPSICGHLGGFCVLAVVMNVAINLGVQLCLQSPLSISFGYVLTRGTAGS